MATDNRKPRGFQRPILEGVLDVPNTIVYTPDGINIKALYLDPASFYIVDDVVKFVQGGGGIPPTPEGALGYGTFGGIQILGVSYGKNAIGILCNTAVIGDMPNAFLIDGVNVPNGVIDPLAQGALYWDQSNYIPPSETTQYYTVQGLPTGAHTVTISSNNGTTGAKTFTVGAENLDPTVFNVTNATIVSPADSRFTLVPVDGTDHIIQVKTDFRFPGFYDVVGTQPSDGYGSPYDLLYYDAPVTAGTTVSFFVSTERGYQTVNVTFP